MSKLICESIKHFVSPLIGEFPQELMKGFDLGNEFRFTPIGTVTKIRFYDRYFLATAKHCTKLLTERYPRIFYDLSYEPEHPLFAKFIPIMEQIELESKDNEETKDVAFYEINKKDALWLQNEKEVKNFFFDASLKCLNISSISALISSCGSCGFIYGYPCIDNIDDENKRFKINQQLIPVRNIHYSKLSPLYLEYDLDLPDVSYNDRLDGMSGGVLMCQDPQDMFHSYPIAMHIQGSNSIGHAIMTPLLLRDLI